jgi:hypothetical protein
MERVDKIYQFWKEKEAECLTSSFILIKTEARADDRE